MAAAFRWYEERSQGLGHDFLRAASVAFTAIARDPTHCPIAIDDIFGRTDALRWKLW